MERYISILGILVLMGLAYVFSKKRDAINYRTIVWGVSLQFLFALIILGKNPIDFMGISLPEGGLSFIGMFIFTSLLTLYIFEEDLLNVLPSPWQRVGALFVGCGVLSYVFKLFSAITPILLGVVIVVFLTGFYLKKANIVRYAFASILLIGFSMLWANGIHGTIVFQALSDNVKKFLDLTNHGSEFLFGNLIKSEYFFPDRDRSTWPGFGFQFAFSVLPTIIFFSAFMSVLYYIGIIQVVIGAMAKFMRWSMRTSGSETLSCSANVFVGQTEAPFLIKPFLNQMTISELHAIMVGGFATIAGGVLAGYIKMGVDPGHLIAASVMSAPAALVIAKLLYPETEHSVTAGDLEIPEIKTDDNIVGAAASGVTDGLKLAANVGAMLLAFIALIGVVDLIFNFLDYWIDGKMLGRTYVEYAVPSSLSPVNGEYSGYFPGSLKTFFGTILSPLAYIMGVPWKDAPLIGDLLGTKIALNEFVAYGKLGNLINLVKEGNVEISKRSITIATYALCGFANFSSIGMQIGGIGVLAPERRKDLAKIGVRAMFGGALASWMTATIAGILI